MHRIRVLKSAFGTFFSGILIAISFNLEYLISNFSFEYPIFATIVSGLIGAFSGRILARVLFGFQWFRSAILRGANVEGYWIFQTRSVEKKAGSQIATLEPLERPSLTYISYDPSNDYFSVHGIRIDDNSEEYTTHSEIAYIREVGTKILYMNYFKLSYSNDVKFGMAHGSFEKMDDRALNPDYFTANIFVEGGTSHRMVGKRLQKSQIKSLRNKYKDEWKIEYLKSLTPVGSPDS